MRRSYDAIVLGVGGMGSAALFELARRGRRVIGLEQYDPGHDQGSSHGHTRIIRQAYYEGPDYVPLVRRAYERWYDLEQRLGRRLLTECPCLSLGRPDSEVVAGVRLSAAQHALPVEDLTAADLRRRFPAFRFGDDVVGVLERTAGFLAVEDCVRGHVEAALALGAELKAGEAALSWSAQGDGVEVRTRRDTYAAARLIVTAGPWAGRLLAGLGVPLTVMRQVPLWFEPGDAAAFRRDRFPVFIAEVAEGYFYGLPMVDPAGVKVARHYGAAELAGPEGVSREPTDADEPPVRAFLRAHLPGADGPRRRASVCLYTLTPDRHFVIDLHPEHPQVALACGFSGHGFKFSAAVGEVLADLAEEGRTPWPIGLFRLARFTDSTRGR
jgi:sarcosine oxidase